MKYKWKNDWWFIPLLPISKKDEYNLKVAQIYSQPFRATKTLFLVISLSASGGQDTQKYLVN